VVTIVWNDYVRAQMHWAERLFALATDTDNTLDWRLLKYAESAMANADAVKKSIN